MRNVRLEGSSSLTYSIHQTNRNQISHKVCGLVGMEYVTYRDPACTISCSISHISREKHRGCNLRVLSPTELNRWKQKQQCEISKPHEPKIERTDVKSCFGWHLRNAEQDVVCGSKMVHCPHPAWAGYQDAPRRAAAGHGKTDVLAILLCQLSPRLKGLAVVQRSQITSNQNLCYGPNIHSWLI